MSEPTFHVTMSELKVGTAASWYRHDNLPAIEEAIAAGELPRNTGYFVEYGQYNEMADYRSNSWEGNIVDGPFATYEAAEDAILEQF